MDRHGLSVRATAFNRAFAVIVPCRRSSAAYVADMMISSKSILLSTTITLEKRDADETVQIASFESVKRKRGSTSLCKLFSRAYVPVDGNTVA